MRYRCEKISSRSFFRPIIQHFMSPFLRFLKLSWTLLILIVFAGCRSRTGQQDNTAPGNTLFTLLDSSQTHIQFANTLTEGAQNNVLLYQYFYNGGGVAVADLNGDGLQDICFTGNMTGDKLYLNKGHMRFEDVTDIAAVAGRTDGWKTGVTMVDINGDGKMDIYVCYSGARPADLRKNQLFINQGNDAGGVPHFTEEAEKYGLADASFSTQAYFFDYDHDGDLDMLLLDHNPRQFNSLDETTIPLIEKTPDPMSGTKLFRNDDGHFTDVTLQSGIKNSGLSYGLGAGIADINGDGWPDIYISNDYSVPDYLYINNGNGTFTDRLASQIGHTSLFSMGDEIADINNDALPDIFTLDMLPESNLRQKNLFNPDNYELFDRNLRVGFYYQYMRNMLQVNNGNGTFSEMGQLAGISNTDWSWAPLFADFDNDGLKDLFVSNGLLHDMTNNDFIKYRNDYLSSLGKDIRDENIIELMKHMPSTTVKSYFFKNVDGLNFQNSSDAWGISQASNSNGAAYADLDNDGDLDMIVNNVNQPAFVYENTSDKKSHRHYLSVKLKGSDKNTQGIGAKVTIYTNGKKQYLEQMPTRGYQSSVSPVLHYGLGAANKVDSLTVIWQPGKQQVIRNVKADQILTVNESEATAGGSISKTGSPFFAETKSPINYSQEKNTLNDFKRQPLMVNPMSFSTPCMVKADVNADGLEDVYIGGGYSKPGQLFLQNRRGSFILRREAAFEADAKCTDAAAVFFDANGDGKPDLYVCSGGYDNIEANSDVLQDRLYLNDGKGGFIKATNALPLMHSSKSCVKVADLNGDGHPDLFVGGRVIPGSYPETPESYILINDGKGHFIDQTQQWAPQLQHIGMVTGAAFADMNGDHKPDLVLVGEWMPITVLINNNGKLTDQTKNYLDKDYRGWWNTLEVADINHDGCPDLIVGNEGVNTQYKGTDAEPAEMIYKDFDNNGSIDPILCFYIQHKSYPYLTRDELFDQVSMMRSRFPDYESFANATINELFKPEELQGAHHLKANDFNTACFLSNQSRKLVEKPLPAQAQNSPVFTITMLDYDHDGNTDLLLCGNINRARLRFGKYDANYGVLLKGDGKGNFAYVTQTQSGFKITGDVRSVLPLNNMLLFGINQSAVIAYKETKNTGK
jgi:hypothetical protein